MTAQTLDEMRNELRKEVVLNTEYKLLTLLKSLKQHLKLDPDTGPIFVSKATRSLSAAERILLYAFLIRVAKSLELSEHDWTTVDEVALGTDVEHNVANVRMSELAKRKCLVNLTKHSGKQAQYRLTDFGISYIEENIAPKLETTSSA